MFRAQVLRRNFSLFTRIPYSRIVQSAARDGHESVIIHRVRIQRPFFTKSRLVGAVVVTGAAYGLGRYLGVEVEVGVVENNKNEDKWEQAGQAADDEDDDDEDYDDALLFLPTGFSRPKPKTAYRGTDPEWQEFKKVASDPPRLEKIRSELVTMIRNFAAKNPAYTARLGQIDAGKGKLWLEVTFPPGPPIEYEQPGIELTEELEWRKATRPVEAAHYRRLTKLLYPTEATQALYADTRRKATQSWKTLKAYIGWEEKPESDTVQQLVQRIGANPRSSPTAAASSASAATSPLSTAPANETQQSVSAHTAASADGPLKDLGLGLPDPKKAILDLSQFHKDFKKASKSAPLVIPRGAFVVAGLIEVHGERARMTMHVSAAYDPKQGRYVSLTASLWNFTFHKQIPKGAP